MYLIIYICVVVCGKQIQANSNKWFINSGIGWKYNDYEADGTIMDWMGGKGNVSYSLCAEIYGDPTVDNSIDCFVQFNPNNGKDFQISLKRIRALYDHTFSYFLYQRPQHNFSQEFVNVLLRTSQQLKTFLRTAKEEPSYTKL
ncbi:carboxypeptidase A5-like protein [Reticulomyxa filosa]|uniref:Carboxypeptidase A5-like protein n=1 Tax=Reticulomyxa filosa TaxID=46433 RepID=X6NK07_RETFI|nr:carboxypeptidase A5-like protein [Reticulomyxa filosa]|eukprot:ETO26645.1 carboxypeptidase A5-like protein [Reticulomyxa filosa]